MASLEVDPMIAAGIALDHFLSHKKPFSDSDWREPGTKIASEYENENRERTHGTCLER
jgi:hypothetical protein